MKVMFTVGVLIVLLAQSCLQLEQKCSPLGDPDSCPEHSACQLSGYCACNPGWVLDCQTPSELINETLGSFTLTSPFSHFTIVPSGNDMIFVYKFTFCTKRKSVKGQYKLTLFADEGTQKALSSDNRIGSIQISSINQCWELYSPYMEFGVQPNGRIQQMVMEISLPAALQNEQIGETIELGVEEIFIANLKTLWVIIYSFLATISATFVGGIAYCIYFLKFRRDRMREWENSDNDIGFFDEVFPKNKLIQNSKEIGEDCPICLTAYAVGDQIRTVICDHSFHVDCLDEWCRKRMTCPVCRRNLEKEEVERSLSQKESMLTHDQPGIEQELNRIQGRKKSEEFLDDIMFDPAVHASLELEQEPDLMDKDSHIRKRLI